jgi:hypothetical protein
MLVYRVFKPFPGFRCTKQQVRGCAIALDVPIFFGDLHIEYSKYGLFKNIRKWYKFEKTCRDNTIVNFHSFLIVYHLHHSDQQFAS